jgi:hypothetical protein
MSSLLLSARSVCWGLCLLLAASALTSTRLRVVADEAVTPWETLARSKSMVGAHAPGLELLEDDPA